MQADIRREGQYSDESWKGAWAEMIAAIGNYVDAAEPILGADVVEAGLIRRFCEPVEFDCPLHHDPEVARAHGYDNIIAPYASYLTFAIGPLWRPDDPPVFVSEDRDGQPESSPTLPPSTGYEPPYSGYFATDFDIEFFGPVVLGDRLSRTGTQLIACEPKETRVGRGAFTTWERSYENQRGEVVARLRFGLYMFNVVDRHQDVDR